MASVEQNLKNHMVKSTQHQINKLMALQIWHNTINKVPMVKTDSKE